MFLHCIGMVQNVHHKVHIYLEYHSVCPLVGIGTPPPHPLSRKRVCPPPPPGTRGRVDTLASL
jgi:hypothetical protein